MVIETKKLSEFANAGDLSPNQETVGVNSGEDVRYNNPLPLLAPGPTSARPMPAPSMYYRLRFNTTEDAYEYYSPIEVAWVQIEDSTGLQTAPFVIYKDDPQVANAFNLGSLDTGVLKQDVIAGISTPAISGSLTSIDQLSVNTGDMLYAFTTNLYNKLVGNTLNRKLFLTQTGTGTASQPPVWATISSSDIHSFGLTRTNDTNVTLTLGGSPASSLLAAVSLTLGWTGILSTDRGGTGLGTYTTNDMLYASSPSVLSTFTSTAFGRSLVGETDASTTRSTLGLVIGTDVQAQNVTLQSLADLSNSSDEIPYFSSSNVFSTFMSTSFSRGLLANANSSSWKTSLGLVIGTNVEAWSAALDSIAGLTTSGEEMIYTNGVDSYATIPTTSFSRTLLSNTNAADWQTSLSLVPGTDIQVFSDALTSIASLITIADKMIYTTGVDTYAVTSLTSFMRTALASADAAAAASNLEVVALSGSTMTGPLVLYGSPATGSEAATRNYVDNVVLNIQIACLVTPTANLTGYVYNNGAAGVGATLTAPLAGVFTADGVTPAIGNRILLLFQTDPAQNGPYILTAGDVITPAVLTRATDYDEPSEIQAGDLFTVVDGSVYGTTIWMNSQVNPVTVGTTPITFRQLSITGTLLVANNLSDVDNAATSRINLGVEIGTDVQAWSATLDSISPLGTASDVMLYTTALNTWAETPITSFSRTLMADSSALAARSTLGVVIGTNVQAWGAALDSIKGLSTSANQMIYTTALNTYATTNLSSLARTFIANTTTSGMQSTIGLVIGTNVEAWSAALDSIAGLSTSANQMIYTTGTDTYATTAITSLGRSLVGQASTAGMQSTLGLAIGTNIQAWFAGLDSIGGLSTSANQMIYTTASNVYATTAITALGRTLVGQAASSGMRSTLGVVIGTDVQAWSAKLDALAAQTWAADQITYQTSTSAVSTTGLTAFGRTLINSANVSAARATLNITSTGNIYLTDISGSANTVTCTAPAGYVSYSTGDSFDVVIANTNTGACTINIGGIGSVSLICDLGALIANELLSGIPYKIVYNGTAFVVQDPTDAFYGCLVYLTSSLTVNSSVTPTLVTYGGKQEDLNNIYNTGTSKFTPQRPGVYNAEFSLLMPNTVVGVYDCWSFAYKNGTQYKLTDFFQDEGYVHNFKGVPASMRLNGSTDYYQSYVQLGGLSVVVAPSITDAWCTFYYVGR